MSLLIRIDDKAGEAGAIIRELSIEHNVSCSQITNKLLAIIFENHKKEELHFEKKCLKITLEKQ